MQRSVRGILLAVILFLIYTSSVRAEDTNADLDAYKIALTGLWWFSNPTGSFQARGTTSVTDSFDLSKDFGFTSYSTFTGKVDWRFKRKHHLLVGIFPINSSRTTTLTRTFTFQGQTFDVGVKTSATIDSSAYAPGYQYDIIRWNRIILSVPVQVFLGNVSAKLTATGSIMVCPQPNRQLDLFLRLSQWQVAQFVGIRHTRAVTLWMGAYKECTSLVMEIS